MGVDPRFLRTFVVVARLQSFSGAALELGYTQSAVSQHIAVLEADVGATLLSRRPVAPTEAGARLLEHAEPILLRLDAARADVARVASGPPAQLRIGATPLAAGRAAELVAPALAVTVRIDARDAIARAVATGELDTGLVDGVAALSDPLRLPDTGLRVTSYTEEPLVVAAALDHPLAGRGVRLEALVDARWIDAPAITVGLDDLSLLARAEGFRAALVYEGFDVRGLLALIAAGHGLALLPERALDASVTALPVLAPRLVHRTEWLRESG
jgi:DNA-binding transcriptional LysR family regulator